MFYRNHKTPRSLTGLRSKEGPTPLCSSCLVWALSVLTLHLFYPPKVMTPATIHDNNQQKCTINYHELRWTARIYHFLAMIYHELPWIVMILAVTIPCHHLIHPSSQVMVANSLPRIGGSHDVPCVGKRRWRGAIGTGQDEDLACLDSDWILLWQRTCLMFFFEKWCSPANEWLKLLVPWGVCVVWDSDLRSH